MNTFVDCKVFPFMTSSSCTEPPNEKRFETYRRKNETSNWILLYLRSTWNFPFKDECANLMSSSTLGIHGFVDLIFSIKITRIILSGNKKGLFVFTFSVITAGSYYAGKEKWHHTACVILPQAQPNLRWNFQAQPLDSRAPLEAMAHLGSGLGLGCSPSRAAAPWGRGLWHSFRFCCWAANAALPVATAPWDANGVIFFFSAGHCVCPVSMHKCACAHSGTAKRKLFAARLNPATTSAALPCCHDRAFSRRGGATAQFIHFLCSCHIGKGVGARLQGC